MRKHLTWRQERARARRYDIVRGIVLASMGAAILISLGAVRYDIARQAAAGGQTYQLVVRAPMGNALHTFVADYDLTADDCHRARASMASAPQFISVMCEAGR